MNFLFANVSRDKIIAVYVKGTFVTREMNKKSDVDIVPIVRDNNVMKKLQKVRDKNREMLKPSELLPISLTELKNNENSKYGGKLKGKPDVFLRDLEYHKLIYGRGLMKSDYPMRTEDKLFVSDLKFTREKLIPLHKKGKFGFQQLLKKVFWISYNEQRRLGKNPPRTWKGLNKFIKNKNHIIHRAYYFRMNPTKNRRLREVFVNRTEKYLEKFMEELK